jgi:hypothetical protein
MMGASGLLLPARKEMTMKHARIVLALLLLVAIVGCYAASVDTGRTPSTQVIKKPWASCWIYGLVPPSTVETAAKCPSGVATVKTNISFVNGLVGILTLGIYTPMEIVVTCADESSMGFMGPQPDVIVPWDATQEQIQEAFALAADQAVASREPVLVRLEQ